jgi:regulator of sirC expression with transglutaminase-like and TPR domain
MVETAGVRQRLAGFGRLEDRDFPPAETALWLAALTRPRATETVSAHLGYLTALADEVRAAAIGAAGDDDATVERQTQALTWVIDRRHAFRATHDDGEEDGDCDLIAVIDPRRGDPDSLGLLMLDVARRAGLTADGLAFPCRLLLRIEDSGGRRLILDPAACARPLDTPDLRALLKSLRGLDRELEPTHFAPLDNRAMLARVQNGVKLRLLRLGRLDRALAVVQGLLLVAPDQAPLWREAGLMHLRQGNPRDALAALEQFVVRTTDLVARARALALMADLKSRLH